MTNAGECFLEEEDRVQGSTEYGCWKDRCFCFGTTWCAFKPKPKIIHHTENTRAVKKNRVRGKSLNTYGTGYTGDTYKL